MSILTPIFYSNVLDIPKAYWDNLNCSGNKYYSPTFLKAFEDANKDIVFNYIIILEATKPVAFAYTQIVTIGVETITKNIKMPDWLRKVVYHLLCNNEIRVLFCGNVFLSGEYGTFLKTDEDKVETFDAIARGVKQLIKSTRRLHAIFIKDFKNSSLDITDQLKKYDYASMHVEPNMIIHLKPEWTNFDDYKNALKSKYRVKANKADSKSSVLTAKLFSEQDIEFYKNELQSLYQNTIANSNFNAQVLNLNTYVYLKHNYKDDFIVKAYFIDNELVGFLSAMLNQRHLDAHFIGIDYNFNKQYAIYPRILNDYVRIGIEKKAMQINLGRTASEIKSTLGAVPETLTCYCKHKRVIPNKIIKPFIKNVQVKSFKQHHPFK